MAYFLSQLTIALSVATREPQDQEERPERQGPRVRMVSLEIEETLVYRERAVREGHVVNPVPSGHQEHRVKGLADQILRSFWFFCQIFLFLR